MKSPLAVSALVSIELAVRPSPYDIGNRGDLVIRHRCGEVDREEQLAYADCLRFCRPPEHVLSRLGASRQSLFEKRNPNKFSCLIRPRPAPSRKVVEEVWNKLALVRGDC